MSPALFAYRVVSAALSPLAGPYLRDRGRRGKEDAQRLGERFGRTATPRPAGGLIWLHGASVGEARVLTTLITALAARRADLHFLITTATRTSAAMLAAKPPPRTLHQFAPIDTPAAAARFLRHWRPDLAVFAESEIWPNTLAALRAGNIPAVLVNARMSPKSLNGWGRFPAAARDVFSNFAAILAADARTATGLSALAGRPATLAGNLKLAAPTPAADPDLVAQLRHTIGARTVWLAASTHPGEDEIALAAQARVRERFPDALLILAPRHPERGAAVAALAGEAPRRSLRQWPDAGAGVFVWDTVGELGAAYACARVALVAGSLRPGLAGHNPVEPAQLGAAILTGPHVDSFADLYADLIAAGGARMVDTAEALAAGVIALLQDDAGRDRLTTAARAALAGGTEALDTTLAALSPLLPREPRDAPA